MRGLRTILLSLTLGACAGAPLTEAGIWQPAEPRDPLVLNDQRVNPNVPSVLPPVSHTPLLRDPFAEKGMMLPDGKQLIILNGVVAPPKLAAPKGTVVPAAAAIFVGPDRMEWYVHLDGSHTTTMWVWDRVLLRWEAMSVYVPPGAALR